MISSNDQAIAAWKQAWTPFVTECRQVLGSELHYQAMAYYSLRKYGHVPSNQLAMNVKMWVQEPQSELFKRYSERKKEGFRDGFETIPDLVIFHPDIQGDWRRRRFSDKLDWHLAHMQMLLEMELKASERKGSRIRPGEVVHDIKKLFSHREEVNFLRAQAGRSPEHLYQVVVVVDTARDSEERMTDSALETVQDQARGCGIHFCYFSPEHEIF